MLLSANLSRLESSILTRAKRVLNRNNVATEKRNYFFFFSGDIVGGGFYPGTHFDIVIQVSYLEHYDTGLQVSYWDNYDTVLQSSFDTNGKLKAPCIRPTYRRYDD